MLKNACFNGNCHYVFHYHDEHEIAIFFEQLYIKAVEVKVTPQIKDDMKSLPLNLRFHAFFEKKIIR